MRDIPTIPSFVYDPNIVTSSPLVSHGHLDQTPHNGGEETPHNGGVEHYDDLQDAQGPETVCTPDGIDSPHAWAGATIVRYSPSLDSRYVW